MYARVEKSPLAGHYFQHMFKEGEQYSLGVIRTVENGKKQWYLTRKA
jgi:hypothetical protein